MPAVITHCVHCGRSKVNRPRGLCWRCFYTPGLKERFPPVSAKGRRGIGHTRGPMPITPTAAQPGSPEKLDVLVTRAAAGFSLWHPLDGQVVAVAIAREPARNTA